MNFYLYAILYNELYVNVKVRKPSNFSFHIYWCYGWYCYEVL